MACPLCNEKRFVNIKDYNCEELVKQYKAAFSVDVSGYFDVLNSFLYVNA